MKPTVALLCASVLAASCRASTADREDVAGARDSPALATFLQPLEVRLRDDRALLPDRHARELTYPGTGYSYYSPYAAGHYSPYSPLYGGQHAQYSPYVSPYAGGLSAYGAGTGTGGFGGLGGFVGTGGLGGGGLAGGYGPAAGQMLGYGIGQSSYPYGGAWNALQSPVGYGNQLNPGYYNRGLYV